MKLRVVKSKRKTLCLTVERDGSVLVRAPVSVSDKEIENFVLKHERWLVSRIAKRKQKRSLCLDDGERVVLFGETFQICAGEPSLGNGIVRLPVSGRESAFAEIVKALAKEKMTEYVKEISSRYGFGYSRVRISSARTRWGSCSKKGVLSFIYFLAFTEPESAIYVAVHELCHTRYFNHGEHFWREVENILPDWRARRAKLRREEDCLDYLR